MIKRIKISIALILLCGLIPVFGQTPNTIIPIGWPYPTDSIQAIQASSALLYVAHRDNSLGSDSITISTWDGNNWSIIPVPKCSCSNFKVRDMAVYNNELYIAGEFNNISGIANSTSIIKYTGTAWTDVDGGITNSSLPFPNSIINHLEVYNNSLYAAGVFDSIGSSVPVNNIAKWNGALWDSVSFGTSSEVIALEALNGELYGSTKGTQGGIIEITPSSVSISNYPASLEIHSIGFYNGNLFIRDRLNNTFVVNGSQLTSRYFPQAGTGFTSNNPTFVTLNDILYNFNDIISPPFSRILSQYDGISWSEVPISNFVTGDYIYDAKIYKGNIIVSGEISSIANRFSVGILSTNTANLSGTVYQDGNTNCIKNGSDIGQKNRMLEILPGPFYAITNDTGYYSIDLPDSTTYTITLLPDSLGINKYWQSTSCSPSTVNVLLDSNVSGTDFSVEPSQSVVDIQVELTGSMSWRARQGFTQRYYIDITNIGTITSNAFSVKLEHDSLNFIGANIAPSSANLDSLDWVLAPLTSGQSTSLTIDFIVPTSKALGSFIEFSVNAYSTGDNDYNNNTDSLKQTVVAAIDPNDKQTNPTGKTLLNQRYIDYQIRFQNMGSDTAIKVTVVDTVDNKLPLTSIVMQSLTHSYSIKVQNNAIIWTFDNIMLPHAASDSLGSIGHIKYRAYIAPGLAKGDTITNRADIYFDFQQLLKTNTVINWVPNDINIEERGELSHLLNVYPNPSSSSITLDYKGSDDKTFYMINTLGQKIIAVDVRAHIPKTIDISNLPSGFYFIRSADSSIVFKLLVN